MANEEQLSILKQGVEVWNRWRKEYPTIKPDLSYAELNWQDLSGTKDLQFSPVFNHIEDLGDFVEIIDFHEVNLRNTSLIGTSLVAANMERAILIDANLSHADLRKANLINAILGERRIRAGDRFFAGNERHPFFGANLQRASLKYAQMTEAILLGIDLSQADIRNANLSKAQLNGAVLSDTFLDEADFTNCSFGNTKLMGLDLSKTIGLDTIRHQAPSTIGVDTIYLSKAKISFQFLIGCGLPDSFVDYIQSLEKSWSGYYSCFISYSSKDHEFAEKLHDDLQNNGVRCWFDREDLKIGDSIRPTIDRQIKLRDKLLVILSENSIKSEWVGDEVEGALEEEQISSRSVLFPIRLDDTVLNTREDWAAKIKRRRHIGDFSNWKDKSSYHKSFERLLRDLKATE